jgi:hypothetical protein
VVALATVVSVGVVRAAVLLPIMEDARHDRRRVAHVAGVLEALSVLLLREVLQLGGLTTPRAESPSSLSASSSFHSNVSVYSLLASIGTAVVDGWSLTSASRIPVLAGAAAAAALFPAWGGPAGALFAAAPLFAAAALCAAGGGGAAAGAAGAFVLAGAVPGTSAMAIQALDTITAQGDDAAIAARVQCWGPFWNLDSDRQSLKPGACVPQGCLLLWTGERVEQRRTGGGCPAGF